MLVVGDIDRGGRLRLLLRHDGAAVAGGPGAGRRVSGQQVPGRRDAAGAGAGDAARPHRAADATACCPSRTGSASTRRTACGCRCAARCASRVVAPPHGEDVLRVAVCAVPLMSNFTDVDALAAEPGVVVRFVDRAEELADADLVVLPGHPGHGAGAGVAARARARGRARPAGRRGPAGAGHLRRLPDARRAHRGRGRVAGRARSTGSGCCPYGCGSRAEKTLARPVGRGAGRAGRGLRDPPRGRRSDRRDGRSPTAGRAWTAAGSAPVWGTHWHGSLESDGFRRAFLRRVAADAGRRVRAGARHLVRRAARGAARPAGRSDRGARGHRRAAAADRGRARRRGCRSCRRERHDGYATEAATDAEAAAAAAGRTTRRTTQHDNRSRHDSAVPVHRGRRDGRPAARAAAERGQPRGRRRAGPRREGHRQVAPPCGRCRR